MADSNKGKIKSKGSKRGIIKFCAVTALLLCVSFLDVLFTYWGTPDLAFESNPLVYTMGLGWNALIISNIIMVLVVTGLSYYSFVKFKPEVLPCSNEQEYYSMLYFNRPDNFKGALYKLPKGKRLWRYMLACAGETAAVCVVVLRLRCVLEWCMVLWNMPAFYEYSKIIEKISFVTPIGRFDAVLLVVVLAVFTLMLWFHRQYSINKKALKTGSGSNPTRGEYTTQQPNQAW